METDSNTAITDVNDPRWAQYIIEDTRNKRQPKVGDRMRSWADMIEIVAVGDQMCSPHNIELVDRAVHVKVIEVYSQEDSELCGPEANLMFMLSDLLDMDEYVDPPSYDSAEGDSDSLVFPINGVVPPDGVKLGETTAEEIAYKHDREDQETFIEYMHDKKLEQDWDNLATSRDIDDPCDHTGGWEDCAGCADEKSRGLPFGGFDFSEPIPLDDPPKMIEVDQVADFIESLKEMAEREMKGDAHEYLDRLYMMIRTVTED